MDEGTRARYYPLALQPILKEKVWGGDAVYPLLHREVDAGDKIGEAWIVYGEDRIADGPWAGRTLDEVVAEDPGAVLGEELAGKGVKAFPLLAKFLDAHENLSVQTHPDDDYARAHEGVMYGKAEFWYILHTEPGARIIHGVARNVGREDLAHDLNVGKIDALQWVNVAPGQVVLNLPGTIHATGAGIVLYELQQSSDITYRLYDWNRGGESGTKRELHLGPGLEVADLEPLHEHLIEPVVVEANGAEREILCACRYFAADLVRFSPGSSERFDLPSFHAWTVLSGGVTVEATGRSWTFPPGSSFVLPAVLGRYTISAGSERAEAIRAYVPDLERDIVRPLEARGVPPARIEQLAGERGAGEFNAR